MSSWRDVLYPYQTNLLRFAELHSTIGTIIDSRLSLIDWMAGLLDMWDLSGLPVVPWDQDLVGELARNNNCPGLLANGWWQRKINQIDRATIHHTYGWVDLYSFCEYYVNSKGGRPSSPYTIWITPTGQIILVNELAEGCWHDHTGHENTHLSIGLAGALHLHRPPDVQLQAAARACKWAIDNPEMPLVNSIDHVNGHDAYYPTACPGWDDRGEGIPSGYWRDAFYAILAEQLL